MKTAMHLRKMTFLAFFLSMRDLAADNDVELFSQWRWQMVCRHRINVCEQARFLPPELLMMPSRPADPCMRVGIVLPNWIGDVVMATPAVRAIRKRFGSQATYVGIMKPYVAPVLDGLSWFDDVVFYDSQSVDRQHHLREVSATLRHRQLDWIFLFPNSFRTGLMARLSGARRRVGYARSGRGMLLTDRLVPLRRRWQCEPMSAIDYYLELAYASGCSAESPQLELETSSSDERRADVVWERYRLDQAAGVVALNTGGAYGAAKVWPAEYFAELGRRIAETTDWSVLVMCGPSERGQADEIVWRANHPQVHSLAKEDVAIGLTKACIRRSQLLVTTDSGPRHFAAAFSVPSIAIFGPTDSRWSMNYHSNEVQVLHEVPCRPCGRRTCPQFHHLCMRGLSVESVFAAVQQQSDQYSRRTAA